MDGDAIGSTKLRECGGPHRVWHQPASRLPEGSDVINIHTKAEHGYIPTSLIIFNLMDQHDRCQDWICLAVDWRGLVVLSRFANRPQRRSRQHEGAFTGQ